ncbi:MAG: acyltransferase [Sulfurovum sp.]|nr:acyltransferase [Sulfurovum sp.]
MAYYSDKILHTLGFKYIGKNVKISTNASIYNCDKISINDNSRIDDFCVISGKIKIGKNVHITPMCLIAGGEKGIILKDYTTIAYAVKIFTQNDDYFGMSMTNSTIPKQYKNELKQAIRIGKYSIIGAGSIIMPGVHLKKGTSIGAMSLVTKNTKSWSIYIGSPAKKIKNRSKYLLKLEKSYILDTQ